MCACVFAKDPFQCEAEQTHHVLAALGRKTPPGKIQVYLSSQEQHEPKLCFLNRIRKIYAHVPANTVGGDLAASSA